MSVLVKLDLPGNIALVRVKFSLTQIPRVDSTVQMHEILQQR